MAWRSTSATCAQPLRPEAGVTAPNDGSSPHCTATTEISSIPSQKDGTELTAIIVHSRPMSSGPARRQAEIAPAPIPTTAEMSSAEPESSSVHGRRSSSRSAIGRFWR